MVNILPAAPLGTTDQMSPNRAAVPAALVVALLTMVLAVNIPTAGAANRDLMVKGTARCPVGQKVVGVWIQKSGGGGAWANYSTYPQWPNMARFGKSMPVSTSTSLQLHVGCGGSPSSWASSVKSGYRSVATGVSLYWNTDCGSGRSCVSYAPGQLGVVSPNPVPDSTQCTFRAAAFWKRITGSYPSWRGDAHQWNENAAAKGWTQRSAPRVGALVVWEPSTQMGQYGHVGFVADIKVVSTAAGRKIQLKIYDRNFPRFGQRDGVWIDHNSTMSFIVHKSWTDSKIW